MNQSSTSSVGHTPGPWQLDESGMGQPWEVGTIATTDEPEPAAIATIWSTAADARLIAAAPELLAAARMLIDWAEGAYTGSISAPVYAARQALAFATVATS